jgi:peptide/nickel transport system substrate-binding protein
MQAGGGLGSAQPSVEMYRNLGIGENMFYGESMTNLSAPRLCESYELADDLSYVILHLRHGVQFTKGYGEFTAADAVWSMNDANARTNPTSIHGQAGDFASVFDAWSVIDDYTVMAPFYHFDPTWNSNILSETSQGLVFFSKKAYDELGADGVATTVVATGPMEVVEWVRSDHALLKGVGNWRMTPDIKELRVLDVPEESTRIAMMATGEAQVGVIAIKNQISMVEEGFKTFGTGAGNQMGIFYAGNLWETTNALTGEPLDNRAAYAREYAWTGNPAVDGDMEDARLVRWALAEAIDREVLNETIIGGLGWPEYVEYCQANSPYFKEDWKVEYNLEDAKAKLAQTKTPDGFEIALYPQMPDAIRPELADAIAGMWQTLGSKMKVEVPKYDYSIYRPGVVGRTTPIPWLCECDEGRTQWPFDWPKARVMTSVTRGGFGCGNESPELAQWFLQASAESDIQKRIDINTQVCEYLSYWQVGTGVVAVPVKFVYNPKRVASWTSDVDLWGESLFGIYNIKLTGQ